jgi:hypothetical protein
MQQRIYMNTNPNPLLLDTVIADIDFYYKTLLPKKMHIITVPFYCETSPHRAQNAFTVIILISQPIY